MDFNGSLLVHMLVMSMRERLLCLYVKTAFEKTQLIDPATFSGQ
jgi:hypothetical protein